MRQVFSYDTEGLELLSVRTGLSYKNFDIVTLLYEKPFEKTERQTDMLAVHNESRGVGLEKLIFSVSGGFLGYMNGIYEEFSTANWLYGSARAEQNVYYIDSAENVSEFNAGRFWTRVCYMESCSCPIGSDRFYCHYVSQGPAEISTESTWTSPIKNQAKRQLMPTMFPALLQLITSRPLLTCGISSL